MIKATSVSAVLDFCASAAFSLYEEDSKTRDCSGLIPAFSHDQRARMGVVFGRRGSAKAHHVSQGASICGSRKVKEGGAEGSRKHHVILFEEGMIGLLSDGLEARCRCFARLLFHVFCWWRMYLLDGHHLARDCGNHLPELIIGWVDN